MKILTVRPPLVELGMTALESDIYEFLVENSPATGYRIAKKINKPRANAYEALRSLLEKGAVIVENAEAQSFRALPPRELLEQMERRFQAVKARAAAALSHLKPSAEDERIYRLPSAEHVYRKLRAMLAGSESIALLDLFPSAVEELRDVIEETAARGVIVLAKLYRPDKLNRCDTVVAEGGEKTIGRWPGTWASAIVDGREHLIALLSKTDGRALEAVWSGNVYLSWVYHSALYFEILHSALTESAAFRRIRRPPKYNRMASIRPSRVPGSAILIRRFGENNPASGTET
jgi:predicted transcriptional regulator